MSQAESAARCPFHKGEVPEFPMPRAAPLDPPPGVSRLREESPFAKVRIWTGEEAWLITRYDDIRTIVADPRVSADNMRPNFPLTTPGMFELRQKYPSFITMDAPEHPRFRRMLTSEFTVKKIEAMKPRIQAVVDEKIDAMLAKGPPSDVVGDLTLALPVTVVCDLLGIPFDDHEFFHEKAMIIADAKAKPEEISDAIHQLCDIYLTGLIDRKAAAPGTDLLSRLIVEQLQPGHIDVKELIGISHLLLIAGHETSNSAMALGILALLEHPDQKQALVDDPSLIDSAVEEILRYVDVAHSGRRRIALEDIEIGGHVIKAGEGVIAYNPTGNRDPAHFDDGERFDIRRNARHHMAFGYGVHQCLGQALARAELNILIGTLVRRIPGMRLAAPVSSLQFKEHCFVYGIENLPIEW